MEGNTRQRQLTPRVLRAFNPTRLQDDLLAAVYDRLLEVSARVEIVQDDQGAPARKGLGRTSSASQDRRLTWLTIRDRPRRRNVRGLAIYARVSSKQQAEANTIASQIEALKARVLADGLRLEPELCFIDEGYSGGTLLRPALERLRDQAAAGTFDRVYVHSPDRLARSYPYQVLLVEELQRQGVEIVFLNHDIGRSPEENLLLQVQGMMAEYERAKILERSRRGKRYAAKAGVVNVLGGAPYGYRYIGKYEGGGQARYEVIEAQAEVVRQIFAWVALDRCSIGQVCRQLQDREILSPRGKNYWDRTTVWAILKNSAYVGQARFGKTRVGPQRPRLRGQRGKPAQSRKDASVYDTPGRRSDRNPSARDRRRGRVHRGRRATHRKPHAPS